jgi:hypothetical protein
MKAARRIQNACGNCVLRLGLRLCSLAMFPWLRKARYSATRMLAACDSHSRRISARFSWFFWSVHSRLLPYSWPILLLVYNPRNWNNLWSNQPWQYETIVFMKQWLYYCEYISISVCLDIMQATDTKHNLKMRKLTKAWKWQAYLRTFINVHQCLYLGLHEIQFQLFLC